MLNILNNIAVKLFFVHLFIIWLLYKDHGCNTAPYNIWVWMVWVCCVVVRSWQCSLCNCKSRVCCIIWWTALMGIQRWWWLMSWVCVTADSPSIRLIYAVLTAPSWISFLRNAAAKRQWHLHVPASEIKTPSLAWNVTVLLSWIHTNLRTLILITPKWKELVFHHWAGIISHGNSCSVIAQAETNKYISCACILSINICM